MSERVIQLPFGAGRILVARDANRMAFEYERNGAAIHGGGLRFGTNLQAHHRDHKGRHVKKYDLGSGVVTYVGSLALANDGIALPGVATNPVNLFSLLKYHFTGTGTVAEANYDIKLGTPFTGNTTPIALGVNTLSAQAAASSKFVSVATVSYDTGTGSPSAITEWGLLTDNPGSGATSGYITTGSPATAGSATTLTDTGSALTASTATAQGHTQHIAENTGNATPHWGLIASNTTHIITVPAWYKVSDGTAAGVTPANTDAFRIRPVMFDRRKFGAINVSNGDSIAFTYTLTMTAGG